jgi:RNA polymerase-binding transcription factor DksA
VSDPRPALEAALRRARARLADLTGDYAGMVEASRDSNADDEHDPEGATIAFERAQLASVLGLSERDLAEVDAALARVEAGTYGRCERCAVPISPARLDARPTARRCITCASAG